MDLILNRIELNVWRMTFLVIPFCLSIPITEGGFRLSRSGYILTFLLPMFSTPTMLLIQTVWIGGV